MYCVKNGKICILVFNRKNGKYQYIPETTWNKIPHEKKVKNYDDFQPAF